MDRFQEMPTMEQPNTHVYLLVMNITNILRCVVLSVSLSQSQKTGE